MEDLTRICIDTDVLVDYLRKPSEEVKQLITSILEKQINACITSINAFEIWLGAKIASGKNLTICTQDFLDKLEIINFDYESSKEAANILAVLKKQGNQIDIRDLFIASICKTQNMSLVTRNLKNYKRIPELTVKTPEQAIKIMQKKE